MKLGYILLCLFDVTSRNHNGISTCSIHDVRSDAPREVLVPVEGRDPQLMTQELRSLQEASFGQVGERFYLCSHKEVTISEVAIIKKRSCN